MAMALIEKSRRCRSSMIVEKRTSGLRAGARIDVSRAAEMLPSTSPAKIISTWRSFSSSLTTLRSALFQFAGDARRDFPRP